MATIARGTRRVQSVLESGRKLLNSRCASTLTKSKIVEGSNGERIISSPFKPTPVPNLTVPEYVWQNVESYADKVAVECSLTGRKYTYAQARDSSNYVARSLLNMGLRPGEVVAIALPNMPEFVIALLGIMEAGLIPTTINPYYTVDEYSKQLESSEAKAIITASEIAPVVLNAKSKIRANMQVVVVEDGTKPVPQDVIPFKDLITKGKTLPALKSNQTTPEDLALLPYSSGTTGLPKGVMLTHRNIVADVEMLENSVPDGMVYPTTGTFQEIVPAILPFFHAFGMNALMIPRISRGSKIVSLPKFMPDAFLSLLEKHKPTLLYLVPPILLFLSVSPQAKREHLERLHDVFSGAAPLSKHDVERFYDKFNIDNNHVKFCQGYGLTECSVVSFLEQSRNKYSSIGKPISNAEARIVNPATNEDVSSSGQTGELWIRGPHIMKGYYKNEAETKKTVDDNGWLKTGDVAYYDEDFDFFITDRLKELIKVKGFQVAPAELEALLRTHSSIEEAAVIGVPDARRGEIPRAYVVLKKDTKVTEDEVKKFVKGKVSEYKEIQGGVVFVDSIPKNPSGKILRSKLKSDYLK